MRRQQTVVVFGNEDVIDQLRVLLDQSNGQFVVHFGRLSQTAADQVLAHRPATLVLPNDLAILSIAFAALPAVQQLQG